MIEGVDNSIIRRKNMSMLDGMPHAFVSCINAQYRRKPAQDAPFLRIGEPRELRMEHPRNNGSSVEAGVSGH